MEQQPTGMRGINSAYWCCAPLERTADILSFVALFCLYRRLDDDGERGDVEKRCLVEPDTYIGEALGRKWHLDTKEDSYEKKNPVMRQNACHQEHSSHDPHHL